MRRFVLSLPVALILACAPAPAEKPVNDTRKELEKNLTPRKVHLIVPEIRSEHPSIELVGEIRPFDEVAISSEVAGRVEKISVEVGDRVVAGEELLRLDPVNFELAVKGAQAGLKAARAELRLAEQELARKKDLVSDHTIAQAEFDRAEARRDLAAARVEEASAALAISRRHLEKSCIRSPAAGAIIRRMVSVGQWIDVGEPLVRLAAGNRLKVAARVPSHWAPYLEGMESFTFFSGSGETLRKARVFSIEPVSDQNSRSFEITGVTKAAVGLRPGVFARVILQASRPEETLWLPAEAIVISDTPRVFLVEDGRVAVRRIQTGLRKDGMVEILSGLQPDEKVISSVAGLSRGLPVEISPEGNPGGNG